MRIFLTLVAIAGMAIATNEQAGMPLWARMLIAVLSAAAVIPTIRLDIDSWE